MALEQIFERLPGFGKEIARRAQVASLPVPAPFQAAIARDPVLEEPIRELIAAYVSGDNKLALSLTNPMISRDPVIHSVAKTLYGAQLDRDYKLAQWSTKLLGEVLTPVRQIGSELDLEFGQAIRGFKSSSKPEIQSLLAKRQEWLLDLARQNEDPALQAWAGWRTDLDALYDAYRKAFHVPPGVEGITGPVGVFRTYDQLDDAFQLHLDKATYSNLLDIFTKRVTFSELTSHERQQFQSALLGRYNYIDAIPSDLRKYVPDFFANQYLLKTPRKLEESGVRELQSEIYHYQHRASTDRVAKVLQPLINLLPGRHGALGRLVPSRRQFVQDMMDQFVSNARTGDEQMLQRTFERANQVLFNPIFEAAGVNIRDPLTVNRARNLAAAILRGEYRGFLSIDTAFLDMSLALNTWAENGRVAGPLLQAIRGIDWRGEIKGIPRHLLHERFGYLLEAQQLDSFKLLKTPLEKLRWFDQKLTDIILHPMMFMHNLQRGAAYLAGVEKALASGLDGTTAHRMGLTGASQVVEDLKVTRAQMAALESVARTTFGFSKVETPPIIQGPLGRISFMFMHWTNNQAQALANGLARAYAEGDVNGTLRYLALVGFHTALPSYVAWSGIDITKFVLAGDLSHFTVPFWRQMTDVIYAAAGEVNELIGQTPSVQQLRAIERTKETFKGIVTPQYRLLKEVPKSIEAVKTGFRLDDQQRLWYYTSPMGELLRIFGVKPSDIKATRETVEELRNRAAVFYHKRRQAIVDFLQGDIEGIQSFQQEYGVPITLGDVQEFMREGSLAPVERQLRRTPRSLRELIP